MQSETVHFNLPHKSDFIWGDWERKEKRAVDAVALEKGVAGERGDCPGYVVLTRILNSMRRVSQSMLTGCGLGAGRCDGEASAAVGTLEGRDRGEECIIAMVWLAVDVALF